MSAEECLVEFKKIAGEAFKVQRGFLYKGFRMMTHGSYYDSKVLEKRIKELVKSRLGDENAPLVPADQLGFNPTPEAQKLQNGPDDCLW